ncbi:hypothetical protein EVAR_41027_1 [Eumeta japonica]|uniref:Uncharacterized protein n=1 Tax=Eumeta variegata TaxID=151549 RepID=A0A4C1YX40_EUMVA|nr:hypothetical protein EVAR_41027_1 [Eumeta japonica]
MSTSGIERLTHLPCSPDHVPCDFYLFPKIKEKLSGKMLTDAEEAVAAYEKAVEASPKLSVHLVGGRPALRRSGRGHHSRTSSSSSRNRFYERCGQLLTTSTHY